MLLNLLDLKALIAKLEDTRRDAIGPGCGLYCSALRLGDDGEPTRFVAKPDAMRPVGHVYSNGDTLIEQNGVKGVRISNGVHGRAFFAVDPATGDVCCAACAKGGA